VRGFGLSFAAPMLASVDPWALILALAAIAAMFVFKLGMVITLVGCTAAGVALFLIGIV
jgi:chromate transporter